MIQFLRQKKATVLFMVLVSVMFVLMSNDLGNRGGKDVPVDVLFRAGAPAVRAGSSLTSFFTDFFKGYADLRGVRAENRRLQDALLRTERERDALRELAAAGGRLQTLLDLKRSIPVPSLAGRVAGSGFASGRATLLIDRGSNDGVHSGMPVVSVGGVVGKVVLVSPGLSKVQCIGDPASGVAAILQGSGYQGMIVGRRPSSCELIYVPPHAEVGHGDLVVTSGLDRIYPRGIPIGRVVGTPEGTGLARRFEVKPEVDFQNISEALVLLAAPGTPDDPR